MHATLVLFVLLLIPGPSQAQTLDEIDAMLPFDVPRVSPPTSLPGVNLSNSMSERVQLRQAFFAGQFKIVEMAIDREHMRLLAGQHNEINSANIIDELTEETQLAGLDRCKEWIKSQPRSYSAHLTCGSMWFRGAWAARSNKYAKDVSPAQFALMRERMHRAKFLLEIAITLTERPVEAYTLLASIHFHLDDAKQMEAYITKAEGAAAWYPPIHQFRANYSQPIWGGSLKKVQQSIARAEAAGVDTITIANMRDSYEARPWDTPTPGAEKEYWDRALAALPTWSRARGLAQYYWRLSNWKDMLAATDRMVSLGADRAEGYRMRAVAYENLGNFNAALIDYHRAAALGHNLATDRLIRVHVQGHLGQPAQNWHNLDIVCRYGASLGVPAAANCLGGAYFEATADTAPFKKDIAQSYAWHLLAARGGYHNSQHDLGWMLYTGRVPGVKVETGKTVGLFWLRRAADQQHSYAIHKLDAAGLPRSEPVPKSLPAIIKRSFQNWL